MGGLPPFRHARSLLRPAALLAALAGLACSSTAEHRSLFVTGDEDSGSGGSHTGFDSGTQPDSAAAGGPSEGGTRGPDSGADSGPPLGSACTLEFMPGTVCLLRPDASFTEKGCSRIPGRCEPFEDAG